jgi:hypothetical protein
MGRRTSNRKVPGPEVGGVDGDLLAKTYIEAQDRQIAEISGKPRTPIKSLTRVRRRCLPERLGPPSGGQRFLDSPVQFGNSPSTGGHPVDTRESRRGSLCYPISDERPGRARVQRVERYRRG